MIAKITEADLAQFPQEQVNRALQVVAKQIRERYRSYFTLVMVLPESREHGEMLAVHLKNDLALFLLTAIGVNRITKDGKPAMVVIEPPSVHMVKGQKVVVFDATGDWPTTVNVCEFLKRMGASSIEVGSTISRGTPPVWVNPDYVAFEVEPDTVEEIVAPEEVVV